MALVKIPEILNSYTKGENKLSINGTTLFEIIESLEKQYPGIKEKFIENGEIRQFINIYIDGEDVRFKNGLKTKVNTESEITILPAIAGGI